MSMVEPVIEREILEAAPRKKWTKRERAQIFLQGQGHCYLCRDKILGAWEAEHPVAHALGQPERLEDMRPACIPCHKKKTATEDIPAVARAKRRQAKHTVRKGEERPPSSLQGRGFDKSRSRGFDRKVRPSKRAQRQTKSPT